MSSTPLILLSRLKGTATKESLTTLNRVLGILWALLTAAGLITALAAPLP